MQIVGYSSYYLIPLICVRWGRWAVFKWVYRTHNFQWFSSEPNPCQFACMHAQYIRFQWQVDTKLMKQISEMKHAIWKAHHAEWSTSKNKKTSMNSRRRRRKKLNYWWIDGNAIKSMCAWWWNRVKIIWMSVWVCFDSPMSSVNSLFYHEFVCCIRRCLYAVGVELLLSADYT